MTIRDRVKYAVRAWLGLGRLNDQASHIRIDVEMVSRMQASAENRLMELRATIVQHFANIADAQAILSTSQDREFALIQTERIAANIASRQALEIIADALQCGFRATSSARIAAGVEHKAQYADLLSTQQEMEQKLDRLLLLLEPQVAKLHAPRRSPAKDWNQVEQENLKQFEDGKNNG
jgi:hypothetical protein